jgi:hypothetical protein
MVYALIVYVDCELFYRLTFGHKKRDLYGSLFLVRRAWRVYLTVQVRYGGYQLPTISSRQGCPS